jgi:putative ABC transport system permease protein
MADGFVQDIRFGLRMLARRPAFTLAATVALALGIGANTAIFSVVNRVLLTSLPYREPDRLIMVWETNRPRSKDRNVISPANYLDWQDQNTVFERMAGFFDWRMNLTGVDDPEEISSQLATAEFFDVLGVNPQLGRAFLPNDGQDGVERVAILSHGLWQRRFGGDSNILGRTISLNSRTFTIVGVMPAGVEFTVKSGSMIGKPPEIWLPMGFNADSRIRRGRYMTAIARLKPGVSLAQAQAEMTTIGDRLEQQYPDFNTGWGVNLVPLFEEQVGDIRPALLILFGAVGFVLLIACANVANLLLARGATRHREVALRAALGATRRRIVRQMLTESLLLSAVGGMLGLGLAYWGVRALLALGPTELASLQNVGIDVRILGFTILLSLVTGVIFGIVPAIQASRTDLNESLKEGGRSVGSVQGHRLRGALVIAEVALALILLTGSGLMIRSLLRLQAVNPGFDPEKLLTFRIALPGAKYDTDPKCIGFYRELVERIEALPGVRSAGGINFLPFGGQGSATGFSIVGEPVPAPGEFPVVDVRVITGDYFRAMNIDVKRGRTFTEREANEAARVVVINEKMARDYFPGQDPIGRKVIIQMRDTDIPTEIIGVVGDVKHNSLDGDVRAMSYWPQPELTYSFMTIVVRTDQNPLGLAPAVRREVQSIDRDLPVADLQPMTARLSTSIARTRFATLLLGIFAGVALVLAAVGIYGVMSYAVTERTHEIGIRMALGAERINVIALVLRRGLALSMSGVGLGLLGSWLLTRFVSTLLFQTSTTDPATFAAVAVALTLIALAASLIPARRATAVDPVRALRHD